MVLLHVKGVDKFHEFLYECSAKDPLESITRNVVRIYNLRLTLKVLCSEMKELMKYGPMRNAQLRGLSAQIIEETIPDLKLSEDEQDCDFDLDPTARRVGVPLTNQHVIQTLNELLCKIEQYLSIERVALRGKGVTKLSELEELMNELRGALLIAYPMQLPEHDVLQQILIDGQALQEADMNYSKEVHEVETAQLWFASKKLQRGDVLSKYIGTNEKSKIVVKMTRQKANMPMREPVVDEETRKKMMAFWYKKQEQDKELKQDDDDSYLQTQWANTNALKQSFLGLHPDRIQYRTTDT